MGLDDVFACVGFMDSPIFSTSIKTVHTLPLHYINGLLCLRAKCKFNFCMHEGTLCVCVCVFVPFWSAHLFQNSKYSVAGFLSEGKCKPKFIYLPKESEYLVIVRWRKAEWFLTPGLTLRRALSRCAIWYLFPAVLSINRVFPEEDFSWNCFKHSALLVHHFHAKTENLQNKTVYLKYILGG